MAASAKASAGNCWKASPSCAAIEFATVTLLAAVLSAADAAWFAVLVLYSLEVLGLPAVGFGVLLAIGAVGGSRVRSAPNS